MNKAKVICIVGPTCSGKTSLGITLAKHFNTEIISADSRLVYKTMDIGTAKPTKDEMNQIKHNLVDIINPDETYSIAEYKDKAYSIIETIGSSSKTPIIVGGTGQYFWSLIENWQIPHIEPNLELRNHLLKRAENGEAEELYKELTEKDPERAKNIDYRNVRRVIRALELCENKHDPIIKSEPPFDYIIIGLTTDRETMYQRIDLRVDQMIKDGLVEETKDLLSKYSKDLPSMSGIGYKQIIDYLEGNTTLEEAIYFVKTNTHRLCRMQYNWFRLEDERINWFDIKNAEYEKDVLKLTEDFINKK